MLTNRQYWTGILRPKTTRVLVAIGAMFWVMSLMLLFASERPTRERAYEMLDRNIQEIQEDISGDPKNIRLLFYLIAPAGDSPKVPKICTEVVQKSTNTADIQAAVLTAISAFGAVEKTDREKRRPEYIAVLTSALNKKDIRIKLSAAEALYWIDEPAMGPAYRNIFDGPKLEADDAARFQMILAVRRLLTLQHTNTSDIIREAAEKYDLITFLDKAVKSGHLAGAQKADEEVLKQMKEIVRQEK